MAKWQNDSMLDAALNYIKNNVAEMTACNAQPTTYAEATATFALADAVVGAADVVLADGDVSGRKATVAAKAGETVDASGNATHIALVSGAALLYVTTCTLQALTAGNTVNFPAWDIEIRDAA